MTQFRLTKGFFGPHVTGKLHTMRKEQDFSVLPASDGSVYVQSDKSTGSFDPATGKGILNTKGTTFFHLTKLGGAFDFDFPKDFVTLCAEAMLPRGEETTRGGVTLVNTVEVIG
jgi:hypothetical protein